jgi:hypothetical protein
MTKRRLRAALALAGETLPPRQLPLFDFIPVSQDEVRSWLHKAGRDPDGPRAAWYVRAYNVVEKIARAKLSS